MQAIWDRVKYPSVSRIGRVWIAMLFVLTLCHCATVASAQSYVPPVSTTATTTLFQQMSVSPGRVAVDKAGNVFYQNESTSNGPTELYEIPYAAPATTTSAPILLITGLGLYKSEGVFVDANGNLWVIGGPGFPSTTPTGGTSGEGIAFVEIPALNGIPNTAAIPSGGETADQVAVNNCTATSTMPCVWQNDSFGGSFANFYIQPGDVYVDGAGNVYLVDIYDNTSHGSYNRIVEFNTSNPGTVTLWADNLTSNASQNNSAQLTLGGDGNIYYVDSVNGNYSCGCASGKVYQIQPPVGTTLGAMTQVGTTATLGATAEITAGNGISSDSWGNLYIMSTLGQISEVPNEAGTINFADEFGIISAADNQNGGNGFNYGGSVDAWGNYYSANGNQVYQIQVNNYNFGAINVGSETTSSSTIPSPSLNFYFNANETVAGSVFPTGSPTTNTFAPLLQSFPEDSAATSPAGTSYTPGETVSTTTADFQPIHPGLLRGSYTLVNSSGGPEATVNLLGVGLGPQPSFLPGIASLLFNSAATSSTVATSIDLKGPSGIAVDTFGDIFVADSGNGRLVADCLASTATAASNSFCANSGYAGAVVGLGTAFTTPAGVALDGANNLYVVDSTANTVTMILGGNGASSTLVAATSMFGGMALSGPTGIALDGYANIYVADTVNNRIVQAHQFGATATDNVVYVSSATMFGGTALSGPSGLALDAAGDLFIADTGNNRIVEYSALGITSVVTTTGVTLSAPTGVAVLPSGSLVVTDATNGVSLISGGTGSALSFANTSSGTPLAIGNLAGVALDLSGNIYAADALQTDVIELNVNSPAMASSFPATQVGTTSVTNDTEIFNSGTASLTLSALALDAGDESFGILSTSTCAVSTAVTEDESCDVATDFTPAATATLGPLSGTVTLTDNQLSYTLVTSTVNETAAFLTSGMQTLALSGTAAAFTVQTITFGAIAAQTAGMPLMLSATATSGLAVAFTSTTTSVCTVSNATVTLLATGTCTIDANQAGNSTYAAAPAVSQSFTVNAQAQTITFGTIAAQMAATPLMLSATATSGLAVTFTSTTTSVCTVSDTTVTFLATGTCTIDANQAGNSTFYAAAAMVAQSFTVNAQPQTITFGAIAVQTLGTPLTLSATATSGLAVTFTSTSTNICTVSDATVTFLTIGTCTIDANQAGNSIYAAATMVPQSFMVNVTTAVLFTVSSSTTAVTVKAGQPSSPITITVAPANGLTSTVMFACSGLPMGATCSFSPATITLPGTTSTQLTIATSSASAAVRPSFNPFFRGTSLAIALCCFLGFRKRRALRMFTLLMVSVLGLSLFTGCGGGSSQSSQSVVTVTATTTTSGMLQEAASILLTVQN
jgi:sugar lactone lactonase YvrE